MKNRKLFVSALLGAVLVVFTVHFIDFPGSVPNFTKASRGGVLLDVKPSFTEEAITERLVGYGEEGRKNYTFRNYTVDILLPLSVLPFLFLLMRRALDRLSLSRAARRILLSVPFVYVLFDFAENWAVLTLLANFPDPIPTVANILPFLTVVKRTASLFSLIIPLLIFGFLLVRQLTQRIQPRH